MFTAVPRICGPLQYCGPVPPEKPHWAHLYKEVVTSGLCTGCAGCMIACPHDVLKYDDAMTFRPWKVEEDGGPQDCTHGVKGCTMCTRACPRFRTWETEIDTFMFGRERPPTRWPESPGHRPRPGHRPGAARMGQDGGLVSAILDMGARARHDRRCARLGARGRCGTHLEGDPGGGARPARGARHGGQPLHVLRQHARLPGGDRLRCRADRSRRA